MRRGGTAQREPVDDMADEGSQRAELAKLQRQLRVMENDRKAYAEESSNILRKQETEIENLLAENREMGTVLYLAQSDKNYKKDVNDTSRLMDLIKNLDLYNSQSELQKKRITELDNELKKMEQRIMRQTKEKSTVNEETTEMAIQKQIRVMENRLDKSITKFNQQLAVNCRLRQEIDHLRQEKGVFDNLYKKLTKELECIKSEMNEVIGEASQAYEERDEAQTKMIALKERSEKDICQHEIEMKDLLRIIDHDNKLKEFMMVKSNDRTEYKEEEDAKKKKNAGDKDSDAEKLQIESYEEAFERIQEITGMDDIDTIVKDFIKKENENFALYNYVNELNDEVEHLQDEINGMQLEIEKFQEEDIKLEEDRKKMLKEMEGKADKARIEKEQAEEKIRSINKVLDQLKSGVGSLFKNINCDPSSISDMLGCDAGITEKNILQYMGIIEHRTMELLQIQQYIHLRNFPPSPEKKEKKGDPTPPATQQGMKVEYPPPLFVPAPNTWEEEDRLSDVLDDIDRPLTRDELKSIAAKTLNKKQGPQILSPGKLRSKSPRN